jgi:hypothetical protein
MAEFIFGLLAALVQVLLEVLLEVAAEEALALLSRVVIEVFDDARVNNPVPAAIGYLILGTMAGGLSLLFFPHPLVRPSKVHGISLFTSPAITGSLMWMIGYALRRRGKQAAQIESFGYGFAFALGMALIRFLFVN